MAQTLTELQLAPKAQPFRAVDGYPCLVNGKADAQIICVEPAIKHANVTLLTNAFVERLETEPAGRSVSAVCVDHGGSIGAVNPSLTIIANALRVGDHLLDRIGRGS